ncbi:MAG TPA: hypothetical protein VHD81_01400 [Mycobacteriales bacterium]|nr:hypothetical protein [Mycobacteriales bacterium]
MRWLLAVATGVVLVGCGQSLTSVGGGQILEFRNDLPRSVTFLYCPEQGCARPLSRLVQPGGRWRTANETINGSGAVSLQLGRRLGGCKLVEPVGVLVDPLHVIRASEVRNGLPFCVRPAVG